MKRFHIHLSVNDIEHNINFYSTLFGCAPSVRHDDYAKWLLEDPRVNFAISNRSAKHGLDHLGIQAEDDSELQEIKLRLDATEKPIKTQEQTACCYARSDKHWITDPQGIAWESFHTLVDIPTFNEKPAPTTVENAVGCGSSVSSSCC